MVRVMPVIICPILTTVLPQDVLVRVSTALSFILCIISLHYQSLATSRALNTVG